MSEVNMSAGDTAMDHDAVGSMQQKNGADATSHIVDPVDRPMPLGEGDVVSSVVSKKRKRGSPQPQTTASTSRQGTPAVPPQDVAPELQEPQTIARGPTFTQSDPSNPSPYFLTMDIPMNRQNYRYYPAAQSVPPSQLVYRTLESPPAGSARVSWEDRSPFIKVTPDGLGLMGDKGFRSARCTVPIREGKWYFEVKIEKSVALDGDSAPSTISSGANVRLGWGRREASLNGPVGLDGYSYGIRDRTGEKFYE